MTDRQRHIVVLVISVIAYFLIYPDDITRFTAPVSDVLTLTFSISPWMYGLAAVAVIIYGAMKIHGRASLDRSQRPLSH
ncbi:hypothetical protein [Schlesneria sp.]|uniref:hypothetical protein n=1 Tax=Schlesneria sp. TaxID=2762018 RepID=UPI002F2357A2